MGRISQVLGPRPGRALGVGKQLKAAGDVDEQEFVLHGTADLYRVMPDGIRGPWRRPLRYARHRAATRGREPRKRRRSARALDPAGDMPSAWPRTGRTLLREGMVWIGVTQDVAGLRALKQMDAERYAELDIPQIGLGYDIVAQVAALLRSPESPVPGVRHLFMTGASYTGTFQRVFIGDGSTRARAVPTAVPPWRAT